MTARPWMPLYVADYLADTAHLGALESGAYLHLIMHYWTTGSLPDDARALARIAKVSAHSWKKLSPQIEKFFHDGWKHKRIDEELARVSEISTKRSEAAKARHAKPDAIAPANAAHKQTHSHSHTEEDKKKEVALRAPVDRSDWPTDAFEQFYQKFPHKVGKQAAIKAFAKARRATAPPPWQKIMSALDQYIVSKPADRAWCNPATWLNDGRWDDEPAANGGSNGLRPTNRARQSGADAFFAGLAEVAADIGGDSDMAGPAAEAIPRGRFNFDG
jgi:uncharacterized protein YdaU (DUF1376 family)